MSTAFPRRSTLRLLGGAIAVAAAATTATGPICARPAKSRSGAGPRVEGLIVKLTRDEKISLLHGATDPASLGQAGYVPGVPRPRAVPLRLADSPRSPC